MSEEDNKDQETPAEETVDENAESGTTAENAETAEASDAGEESEAAEASDSAAESEAGAPGANEISGPAPAETAEIIAKSISGKDVNIDALLKVPVSLAIEVGRTRMNMSDLLGTREGSVIELDRHLDEPLDILVNGALIAHGIVVLANEKFGLQITDIVSLEERARSL